MKRKFSSCQLKHSLSDKMLSCLSGCHVYKDRKSYCEIDDYYKPETSAVLVQPMLVSY